MDDRRKDSKEIRKITNNFIITMYLSLDYIKRTVNYIFINKIQRELLYYRNHEPAIRPLTSLNFRPKNDRHARLDTIRSSRSFLIGQNN